MAIESPALGYHRQIDDDYSMIGLRHCRCNVMAGIHQTRDHLVIDTRHKAYANIIAMNRHRGGIVPVAKHPSKFEDFSNLQQISYPKEDASDAMEPKMMKNQLTREECLALLDRTGTAVLSMVEPDGRPYAIPVNFVRMDDKLYYHGRKTGTRVVCMEHNPACCLVAYDGVGFEDYGELACDATTVFESVVVRGKARSVEDASEKEKVLRALTDKLVPSKIGIPIAKERIAGTGIFEITMDEVTGKHHRPREGSRVHPGM